jgi:dienelactone hydrolase
MIEYEAVVTTHYGTMPTFAVYLAGPGSSSAIIFYMDAPGTGEELRNIAPRIAKHGYLWGHRRK